MQFMAVNIVSWGRSIWTCTLPMRLRAARNASSLGEPDSADWSQATTACLRQCRLTASPPASRAMQGSLTTKSQNSLTMAGMSSRTKSWNSPRRWCAAAFSFRLSRSSRKRCASTSHSMPSGTAEAIIAPAYVGSQPRFNKSVVSPEHIAAKSAAGSVYVHLGVASARFRNNHANRG